MCVDYTQPIRIIISADSVFTGIWPAGRFAGSNLFAESTSWRRKPAYAKLEAVFTIWVFAWHFMVVTEAGLALDATYAPLVLQVGRTLPADWGASCSSE